jgi:hypothetical protein
MQSTSCFYLPAFVLVAWLGLVASSVFGQAGIARTNAPVPGVSENTNSVTNEVQDARALVQKAQQIRADCVNNRRRVCGRVLQIVPGGLVVDSGYPDLLRPELSRSWVAPGTVTTSRPPNLVEEKVPGAICVGLVFLTNIPKRPDVKAYDYVNIEAYPAGQFAYQPVPNVSKTIRKFAVRLESAVQSNLDASEK